METVAYANQKSLGPATLAREGLIPSRISMCEDRQSEIQMRIDSLYEKLSNVMMPSCPSECGDKAAGRPVLPPMGDRLESLLGRQDNAIAQLSDILQRLEV